MYKGIVLHWTAGNYIPSEYDKQFYHYLIGVDGEIYKGKYDPSDNLDCTDGKYARHCRGYNTGTIGIAMCCMKDRNTLPTEAQVDMLCSWTASVCYLLKIPVDKVQTHCEISPNRKIDINEIPYLGLKGNKTVGDYLRSKVQEYIKEY